MATYYNPFESEILAAYKKKSEEFDKKFERWFSGIDDKLRRLQASNPHPVKEAIDDHTPSKFPQIQSSVVGPESKSDVMVESVEPASAEIDLASVDVMDKSDSAIATCVFEDAIEVVVPEDSVDDAQILLVESAIEDMETAAVTVDKQNDADVVLTKDESESEIEVTIEAIPTVPSIVISTEVVILQGCANPVFVASSGVIYMDLYCCIPSVCQNVSMDCSSYFTLRTGSINYSPAPILKVRSVEPPAKPPEIIRSLHVDDLRALVVNMNDYYEEESSLLSFSDRWKHMRGVHKFLQVKVVDGNYVYDKGRSDMYGNEWYGAAVTENMKVERGAVTYNTLLAALSKYELLNYSLPNQRPSSLPSENVFKMEGYIKERKMSDIVSCLKDELYPEDIRNSKPKLHLLVALISLCATERSLSNEVLIRCDMVMPISELVDADTGNEISKAISEHFYINGSIVDVSHQLKLCSSIFSPDSKSVAMETPDFCINGVQQYAPEILIHTLLPPAKPPDGFFPDRELLSDNFLAAGLTTMSPTHFVVPNMDGRDGDHSVMCEAYRPPHAIVTNDLKYDYKSMQGYVRSSAKGIIGRITTGTCASTKNILKLYSWSGVLVFVSQICNVVLDQESDHGIWTSDQIESNIVRCASPEYVDKMIDAIEDVQLKDDSNGGSVICIDRTASWRLGILVPDELEFESFEVGHKCHYTYYFSQLKLDIIVLRSKEHLHWDVPNKQWPYISYQMTEQFNQELSLTGKIPSGSFHSMIEFAGSWQTDAANTPNLAFDGVFITLYTVALDKSHIALRDHVRKNVPASWDPAALARFIEMYGTHIIVGLKMGGKDVIYLKQQHLATLKSVELQQRLKDMAGKRIADNVGQYIMESEQARSDYYSRQSTLRQLQTRMNSQFRRYWACTQKNFKSGIPLYDTERYTSLENQATQHIIGSINQQPLLHTTRKDFDLKFLAVGAFLNTKVSYDQPRLFCEEGISILASIEISPSSHLPSHVAKMKPPIEVHGSAKSSKLQAATGHSYLETKRNNLAVYMLLGTDMELCNKVSEIVAPPGVTQLARIDSHNKVIFKRNFAWNLLASVFTRRCEFFMLSMPREKFDPEKDFVTLLFGNVPLPLHLDFSLDELVSLMCFISKIFLFSLPRPPEMDDLEDKVKFKGEGMLRIGILCKLRGLIVLSSNVSSIRIVIGHEKHMKSINQIIPSSFFSPFPI